MQDIVVVGAGVITPIGVTLSTFWQSLTERRNCYRPVGFDPAKHGITANVTSEVADFDFAPYAARIPAVRDRAFRPSWQNQDRVVQFGLAAGLEALTMAHLAPDETTARRGDIGVMVGTGLGGGRSFENGLRSFDELGRTKRIAFTVLGVMANGTGGVANIAFKFGGPSLTITTACASSGHALATAIDKIANGQATAMLVIGAETETTPFEIGCFNQMDAISISGSSIPFGQDRDGFVMGEGAGAVVLMSRNEADKQGLPILARIGGYGMSADAEELSKPSRDGVTACMQAALQNANARSGVQAEDIGYVNAHGTSTQIGDAKEALAIWQLFCDPNLPYFTPLSAPLVSSTKSAVGHCLGASGVLGFIATIEALRHRLIPGMGDYKLDPNCVRPWQKAGLNDPRDTALPFVLETTPAHDLEWALCNAFGFGGHNVSLVVGRA